MGLLWWCDAVSRRKKDSVNKFLRTASTQRLLATIAGFLVAIAAGTAIAIAAQGSGPVPKPKPLAAAIRDAMAAPPVKGVSADVNFTNGLIDTSEIQGSDPLLQGGAGHVWVSDNGQFRLELYGDNGDPEVVVNGNSWWISDPTLQTVYEGTLPQSGGKASSQSTSHKEALPTVAQIQADIDHLAQHLRVSGAAPTDVGGQPTYTVTVSPKQAGGLVGKLQLAWDAVEGVPLRFAVYARGDSRPVLELAASNVSYGTIASNVFDLSPPAGYHVVQVATPTGAGSVANSATKGNKHGEKAQITGINAVAKRLPFKLAAPSTLGNLHRRSVSLMGGKGHAGALVLYGQGLGGIAVIEEQATASTVRQIQLSQGNGDHQNGIALPTFSVHGTTAQELDTALGTLVRFTSGGVTYTVIGSVRPHVARAAARGL
jgi:outer membrane lipoprotein-sorting protein